MFALILAALTVFHFIINFFRSNQVRIFLKEPMIAFVVALSITGIPWKQFDLAWNELMLPFGLFFLINLGNLLLFSFCDHEQDLESGNLSLSIKIGKSRSLILAVLSLIVAVSTVILGLVLTPWTYELIMFIPMILLLSGIAAFPEYFSRKGRYRFWGDMVYLMPLFYLLMH
jgi:1,4-dihydroxy-2-naphthoate octaprenyltransferase